MTPQADIDFNSINRRRYREISVNLGVFTQRKLQHISGGKRYVIPDTFYERYTKTFTERTEADASVFPIAITFITLFWKKLAIP